MKEGGLDITLTKLTVIWQRISY